MTETLLIVRVLFNVHVNVYSFAYVYESIAIACEFQLNEIFCLYFLKLLHGICRLRALLNKQNKANHDHEIIYKYSQTSMK